MDILSSQRCTEDFQKVEGPWEKLMLVYATTFFCFLTAVVGDANISFSLTPSTFWKFSVAVFSCRKRAAVSTSGLANN